MGKKPSMRKMWYYYQLYIKKVGKSSLYNQYVTPSMRKMLIWTNIHEDAAKYRKQGWKTEAVTLLTKNGFMFTAGFVLSNESREYFMLYTPTEDYMVDTKELCDYAVAHGWL